MTSKLTIEQAKRLRNDFECWQQDYDPKDDKEQYDMFGRGMAAMDMLIAGMYQEPVAFINGAWTLVYYRPPKESGLKIGDKLYRHAQPAPVVPECFVRFHDIIKERHYGRMPEEVQNAFDECAAMLQGGNSPVIPDGSAVAALTGIPMIPDGYVMVPKEPTQAMCAAFNDSDNGRKSLRERYVAMLAAAPQEVPDGK